MTEIVPKLLWIGNATEARQIPQVLEAGIEARLSAEAGEVASLAFLTLHSPLRSTYLACTGRRPGFLPRRLVAPFSLSTR
jgi:hypothetical protein